MIERHMFVLAVPDLASSSAFYRDVLGFEIRDLAEGWLMYVNGSCCIMAGECPDAIPARELGDHSYFAYLVVDRVDEYHARAVAAGVELIKPLRDEPWGMREFGLRTSDGHRLMIGSETAAASPLLLHHVALWVADLERMREFYVDALGGTAGPLYENPRSGFRSYFVRFGEARVELMWQPGRSGSQSEGGSTGYAHMALSAGGRDGVDARVEELRRRGVTIAGEPRTTGDGYYEAVIEDPEGNRIEIVG